MREKNFSFLVGRYFIRKQGLPILVEPTPSCSQECVAAVPLDGIFPNLFQASCDIDPELQSSGGATAQVLWSSGDFSSPLVLP